MVEQEAAWFPDAMSSVLDTTAKIFRICARSQGCWNTNIREQSRTAGRDRWRRRDSGKTAWAQAEHQNLIRLSKRRQWRDFLHTLRGAEVWRETRSAIPPASMTLETLSRREGKQGNSSLEKEDMLKNDAGAPNDGYQYYKLRPRSAHTFVTER